MLDDFGFYSLDDGGYPRFDPNANMNGAGTMDEEVFLFDDGSDGGFGVSGGTVDDTIDNGPVDDTGDPAGDATDDPTEGFDPAGLDVPVGPNAVDAPPDTITFTDSDGNTTTVNTETGGWSTQSDGSWSYYDPLTGNVYTYNSDGSWVGVDSDGNVIGQGDADSASFTPTRLNCPGDPGCPGNMQGQGGKPAGTTKTPGSSSGSSGSGGGIGSSGSTPKPPTTGTPTPTVTPKPATAAPAGSPAASTNTMLMVLAAAIVVIVILKA